MDRPVDGSESCGPRRGDLKQIVQGRAGGSQARGGRGRELWSWADERADALGLDDERRRGPAFERVERFSLTFIIIIIVPLPLRRLRKCLRTSVTSSSSSSVLQGSRQNCVYMRNAPRRGIGRRGNKGGRTGGQAHTQRSNVVYALVKRIEGRLHSREIRMIEGQARGKGR